MRNCLAGTKRDVLGIPRAISGRRGPVLEFRTPPAFSLTSNHRAAPDLPSTARIVSAPGQDTEFENLPVHGPFKGREEV